jgi:hypothetical protein
MMTIRLFSILPVLAALAGACSPSFEADLTEIEVTQRGLKVPAVPTTAAGCDVSVAGAFTLSSSEAAWAKGMNSGVRVHNVKVSAGGTLPSLDFIRFARMTMAATTTPERATEIMDFIRGENAPSSPVIEVDIPAPVDITAAWTADKTVITFNVIGQLPTQDWTVDVTLKLSGKITYKY